MNTKGTNSITAHDRLAYCDNLMPVSISYDSSGCQRKIFCKYFDCLLLKDIGQYLGFFQQKQWPHVLDGYKMKILLVRPWGCRSVENLKQPFFQCLTNKFHCHDYWKPNHYLIEKHGCTQLPMQTRGSFVNCTKNNTEV